MGHTVYIIYSESLDQYYVGETEDIDLRLQQHLDGYYAQAYTSRVSDWQIRWQLSCTSRSQARKIEAHIKRMKSRQYILNLVKYSEMAEKLLERYP